MSTKEAETIVQQALELGYESCGIIPVEAVVGYGERLAERISRFPETEPHLAEYRSFARPRETHPWARSLVVCVRRYGQYRVPEHLEGMIGKLYLMDNRREPRSRDYRDSREFEDRLRALGLRTECERHFGVTAMRWAGQAAGLGTVRRNNFFYTQSGGSWVVLEAWLIDRELELVHKDESKPCPPGCARCIQACPTGSLAEPYQMNRSTCISCLTTWEGWDLTTEPLAREMGGWVYGCDACQDACPFNRNRWSGEEEFPGLEEIAGVISLEKLIDMEYEFLRTVVKRKFWYIPKAKVWRFKTNALNAMRNGDMARYAQAVERATRDEDPHVRKMAAWVRENP